MIEKYIVILKALLLLSLNYHRPPTDSCALSTLNKDDYTIDCQIVDESEIKREIIPILFIPMYRKENLIF